jgi:hypothetical protein
LTILHPAKYFVKLEITLLHFIKNTSGIDVENYSNLVRIPPFGLATIPLNISYLKMQRLGLKLYLYQ